jgi:hypothetical protein
MKNLMMLPAILALVACTNDDAVIFATATSIALDADATKSSATIGYDRFEGVSAPVFANGEIPPVYASIGSNLGIVDPEITQEYATGRAALNATGSNATDNSRCNSSAGGVETEKSSSADLNKKNSDLAKCLASGKEAGEPFYFTTATTLGLKLGFSGGQPSSATLGFKRIEASVIPARADDLGADANEYVRHDYMSVYARMAFSNRFVGDATVDDKDKSDTAKELGIQGWPKNEAFYGQVIATGSAAEKLAEQRKEEVTREAVQSLVTYAAAQDDIAVAFRDCVARHEKIGAEFGEDLGSPADGTDLLANPERKAERELIWKAKYKSKCEAAG